MALSFISRSAPEPDSEALVFADGFAGMDKLTDHLDSEFGETKWRQVSNQDAGRLIEAHGGKTPYAIFAISTDVPQAIEGTASLIREAKQGGYTIMLVVGEISTRSIHRLMREGAAEFAPFPDEDGLIADSFRRLRSTRMAETMPAITQGGGPSKTPGRILTAYGAAGGVGASTFIVNLAWELAAAGKKSGASVALLDFNFQYGSVATYLDVPRREAVYELVSDASMLDHTGLIQALSVFKDRLHVLTAPRDALPLDIVSPADVNSIVQLAREGFDYVLIDMPQALMNWSEQVYIASDTFYALMEVDMRSAQNMFRFLRTLKAEEMPLDKIRFVMNRAPGRTDLSGKARVKRVAESLGIQYAHMLPEGGKAVMNACDQGVPLSEAAKSNPLRREIAKIAAAVIQSGQEATTAGR